MAVPPSRLFLGIIPWYGLLIVLGMILAVILSDREAKRISLPPDTVIDLALILLPAGILGARLYYVIFAWNDFRANPLSVFEIWKGGLAIYGGLLGGFCTVVWFCRRKGIPLPLMLDILMPGVALAQAIGRWGNYFNQEAYGLLLPEASPLCFFPLAVLIQEGIRQSWHLAAFFFESCWDFLIFCFLLWGRRKLFRKQGDVFLWYLLLYGAGRQVIESLRMDSLYLGEQIRVSQLLSILLVLAILLCFIHRRKKAGSLSGWLALAAVFAGITGVLLLCSCLPVIPSPFLKAPPARILFLGFGSLGLIMAAILLYGGTTSQEVIYACHKAE